MRDVAGDDETDGIRTVRTEDLARTGFSVLRRTTIDYRRRDGTWQRLERETYDHGNGAAILLYDPARDCVLLVRQFRYPAYINPTPSTAAASGWTLEVPAGMLSDHAAAGRGPGEAIRVEAEEEAGVRITEPRLIADAFMSPGSLTERVALFVGTYTPADRTGPGGGLADEGEDIEIVEPRLDEALAMVASGAIADAKTIILLYWAALNRAALGRPGT